MNFGKNEIFIHEPSADMVVVDADGRLILAKQAEIDPDSISTCSLSCYEPCEDQVWEIAFNDVDFGDCDSCSKSVSFTFSRNRNGDFDNNTLLSITNTLGISYDGPNNGVVSGADLAAYFGRVFNEYQYTNESNYYWGISAVVNGSTVTLTIPCKVAFLEPTSGIALDPDNNLLSSETPVVTLTNPITQPPTAGQWSEGQLSREDLLRHMPLMADYVPGSAPSKFFYWCEQACIIRLKACIPACDRNAISSVMGGNVGSPVETLLFVNSAATGYAAFITALNAASNGNCALSTAAVPAQGGKLTRTDVDNMGAGDGLEGSL